MPKSLKKPSVASAGKRNFPIVFASIMPILCAMVALYGRSGGERAEVVHELAHTVNIADDATSPDLTSSDMGETVGGITSSALKKWMTSGGASFGPVEIVTYGVNQRGLHATRDMKPGENVLFVPDAFIITPALARASRIGERLEALHGDWSAHLYLAFFLLQEQEQGEASWWHPYITSLPTSFANMPVNFASNELELLEGSHVRDVQESDLRALRSDYADFCERLEGFAERFSFAKYKWARLAVLSRTFSLVIDGKRTSALMPLADMLNHADSAPNTSWDYQNGGQLKTVKHVARSSALSITYGDKGNEELLSFYGFALRDNPYNEAVVYIGLHEDEADVDAKVALAGHSDARLYRLAFKLSAAPDHPKFQEALRFCRLVVASAAELEAITADAADAASRPITVHNEREALLLLQDEAETALLEFPEIAEFDELLLQDEALLSNERNIILTRLGEKHVLDQISEYIDSIIPLLDGLNDAQLSEMVRVCGKSCSGTWFATPVPRRF